MNIKRQHATCVAIGEQGLLILGPAGTGKSDLALRLIDGGAALVADDQVELTRDGDAVLAAGPAPIRDRIEARHVGILKVPARQSVQVKLVIAPSDHPERLPLPQFHEILGLRLPLLRLPYFEASTCAKIRLWLRHGPAED